MYPEYEIALRHGRLRWRGEYDDSCRLQCEDDSGRMLALESDAAGFHLITDGAAWRAEATVDERCVWEPGPDALRWRRDYPEHGVIAMQEWRKIDADTVEFICRIQAQRAVRQPHLSFGLLYLLPPEFSRYRFAYSMTQMGYSFPGPERTLWMLSLPPADGCGAQYAGCQGLMAENPDPATLEFHLRLPPGYVAPVKKEYTLQPQETLEIRGAVSLRDGAFYQHAEANESLTGRSFHPARYSYDEYIAMTLENFLDARKYYPCGGGILYHTAVDGDSASPRVQYWTEGPGWGGACDAENAWNLVLCARHLPERRDELLAHARKMLHGWLGNPRFRVPDGVFADNPGDLDAAYVTTGWFPDCIWTIAQADLMLRLADIHRAVGWEECLPEARKLGEWVLAQQRPDGSIPTVWQFPVDYPPELGEGWRPYFSRCNRNGKQAEVLVGAQPVSACFLAVALRHLAAADAVEPERWHQAAERLMQWAVPRLAEPLGEFGGGECDYLVYRARSIDPTGIAYILRGLAEEFDHSRDSRIPELLCRYMDIFAGFAVHWDCDEARLRPGEKMTLAPYGADIRLAGGITHGNWMPVYRRGFGGRFNLLMNRNEIADGMYHAWRITRRERDLEHLRGFANWQTYFQFLNEVPGSPVSTRGSCPQNHFWTTDEGNWNNDYALTAFKWSGTYWTLLDAGITG